MKRDFKSCLLYALFGLPIFLLLFIATIYVANCGFTADCSQASLPPIIHTPIPSLIPVSTPKGEAVPFTQPGAECLLTARELLADWVGAGYSESAFFDFRDTNGNICRASFADVLPLFTKANLWYKGALACDACHNSQLSVSAAGLDLSSYAGVLAGGKRTTTSVQGEDILGGGDWEISILNEMLFVNQLMPFGAPAGALSAQGPTIQAGVLVINPTVAPTTGPSEEEVARPHNPGGPGDAINLTGNASAGEKVFVDHCEVCHGAAGTDNVLNPGSDDGTIPPLNPIDPTLVSSDYKTFAYNLDLFIQNGSVPEGPNAAFRMANWGDSGALSQQEIADVIAYLISLNQP